MVSEAARQAAPYIQDDFIPEEVMAGDADPHWLVQLLARFEADIRADQVERDAKVADDRASEWKRAIKAGLRRVQVSKQYADGAAVEAEYLAHAIRQKGSGHAG